MRIAILVYCYPVAYSPTILDTALYWARRDYIVDLLVDRFVYAEIEKQHPNINIIYCTSLTPITRSVKSIEIKRNLIFNSSFITRISVYHSLYKSIFTDWLMPLRAYASGVRKYVGKFTYLFIIAFDADALIAADWSGLSAKYPYYYHSLELYENNTFKNRLRRKMEKKACAGVRFVVVQDEQRAAQLISGLDTRGLKLFLCPVSVMGPSLLEKGDYIFKKYNIPSGKKIILYTGAFYAEAFIEEMAYATNDTLWNNEWVMLLHGFCNSDNVLEKIRSKTSRDKVILSLNSLSQGELDQLTASAHIGLALYKQLNANLVLTVFSSGKMAQYAKCSLPVVLTANKISDEFINNFGCGLTIPDEKGLCRAISGILSDYERYRLNMIKTFEQKFNFETNYKLVADAIQ